MGFFKKESVNDELCHIVTADNSLEVIPDSETEQSDPSEQSAEL